MRLVGILGLLLSGCNLAQRLSTVGSPPELSQIENPTLMPGYQRVSMPMPDPQPKVVRINSLWESGSKTFFKDQRASRVGDIIKVQFTPDYIGKMESTPAFTRTPTTTAGVNNILGHEKKLLGKWFPRGTFDPKNMVNMSSTTSLNATGKYDRKDKISFSIAATVIQILPNSNLVIKGRQEVRLHNEVLEITIVGVVRREDISAENSVTQDQIAEARVSYGGRGDISDMQQFPWMHQAWNKITPF